MTTARPDLDTVSLGSCPTCGGPAQFVGGPGFDGTEYREVRLPNIDEDLGGMPPTEWHLLDITRAAHPFMSEWTWRATARDRDRMPDVEYGWGDSPSAAYLALRTAIEKRA
jgi:hypothetical protein